MPINKALDKNGKPIKKDGKIKYRVRVNYTDSYGNSKQIERTAYGADEAKQLERELTHSVKVEKPSAKIAVQQLYEEYLRAKQHEIREVTYAKKKEVFEHHILPYFGKMKLDKLNVQTLQKWKESVEEQGYSIAMRKNMYKEFRAMLNFGVKMEYLPKNPLLQVGNFVAPMEDVKEMDFYTPEEFQKYIKVARERAEKNTRSLIDWNYYVFFCIAYFTGMRKGEIYALNWNDIKNGEINITKSLSQKLKGEDRITPPKNRSSIRKIQIPDPLQKVLDEHFERCQQVPGFINEYFVCGGIHPVRDSSVFRMNKKFAELAGVKKIRIHDFRHSHASYLANYGINIQEVAKRLGHSNIGITLRTYSHLYPKESERALTALNEIDI